MSTLDKEEFRIKLEEINKLIEKKDYEGAMAIVDSIDWRKVKNIRTLCVVGEIYAANKRYEESREIFLLAYHRAPIGKSILYRLIEVSLRMGDVKEAEEFYEEYKNVAPNDTNLYVLKYKILRVKKAPLEQQIEILEEYKEKEFTEKWSFELAKLYYKAGERKKSLEVCDDLILWFSEGKYVLKALDLKMRMGAITQAEKEKYEAQFVPKLLNPKEAAAAIERKQEKQQESSGEEQEIGRIKIPEEEANIGGFAETTGAIQEKIAKGIKDIFSGIHKEKKEEPVPREEAVPEPEVQEYEKKIQQKEPVENTEYKVTEESQEESSEEQMPGREETPVSAKNYSFEKADLKMPEWKMPDMAKMKEKIEAPKAKIIPEFVMPDEETLKKQEQEKEKNEEHKEEESLNLEDLILAAASEQGIDVNEGEPEPAAEEKEEETVNSEISSGISEEQQKEFEVVQEDFELEEEYEQEADEKEVEAEVIDTPDTLENETEDAEVVAEAEDVLTAEAEVEEMKPEADILIAEAEEEPEFEKIDLEKEAESLVVEEVEEEDTKTADDEESEKLEFAEADTETLEEADEVKEEIKEAEEPESEDIIPREMKFDEEEEQLFSYFVKIPGMKEQILDALLDTQLSAADKTSKAGNVIVMGNRGCGKTRLIQGFIPAVCRELHMEAAKVAYVFGDELNGQDIAKIVDKMSGGFLVIEQANQMTADTVEQLNQAMEFRTDGLTVIIEDEKIGMRKLIAKYPKFAEKFTSMINIPVFTNDELVSFAKIYTEENGYVIDQMGILALYNLIGSNQKEDEPMTIQMVKQMVDTAIERADSGARKLKRNLSKKRTNAEGKIILYEKDFN